MGLNGTGWLAAPAVVTLSATPATLGSISRMSINAGSQVQVDTDPGNIWPGRATLKGLRPNGQLGTKDIAAALSIVGPNGLCVSGGDTIDMHANQHACSAVDSGDVHNRYRFSQGIMVPKTLRAAHQEDAEMTIDVIAASDGVTSPVVITNNLSAVTQPASSDRWTLGPVVLGGDTFACKTNMEVDFGIKVKQRGCDSEFFDSMARIESIEPTFKMSGLEPTWVAGSATGLVDILGGAAVHADTTIYFANRNALPTATEHIRLTMNGLITVDDIFASSGRDEGGSSVMVTCNYDGSLSPIVVTVGVALPS